MPGSATIKQVWAREVLNFRGNPTVEAEVVLSDGSFGRGAVAAGISAGINEVGALLDGDSKRFAGRGTLKLVSLLPQLDIRDEWVQDVDRIEVQGAQ